MLEQLFIDKGDTYRKKSKELRDADPVASFKFLYLAKDYFVRAMLEDNRSVKHTGYTRYKEIQKESWNLALNLLNHPQKEEFTDTDNNISEDADWLKRTIIKSEYTFDDLQGYDYIKEKFKVHMIYPLTCNMPFKIHAPNTILMYGPPGCGKTFFVSALANEIPEGDIYSIDASNILSKYYGETSKNLSEIFSKVKENKNNVLFIDEVDSLSMTRDSNDPVSNRTLSTLLTQIDGVDKTDMNLIAATNRPDLIDDALLSRFNSILYIGPPDTKEKEFILDLELKKQISGYVPDLNLSDIANYLESKETNARYSGRDIRRIVTNVLEIALIDYAVNSSFTINNEQFYNLIDESVPSIDSKAIETYNTFSINF